MKSARIVEPASRNKQRVMAYYGYKGVFGTFKYYCRSASDKIFQTLALCAPHPGIVVFFHRLRGVRIGRHVFIGQYVKIDGRYPSQVTLEPYVSLGMDTMIFAHSDPAYSYELEDTYYPAKVAPTVVKRGAWIAPGVIVLAGVTIGEYSVVGAGSVVTKNVEPYTVVAGNPARVIKKLDPTRFRRGDE